MVARAVVDKASGEVLDDLYYNIICLFFNTRSAYCHGAAAFLASELSIRKCCMTSVAGAIGGC